MTKRRAKEVKALSADEALLALWALWNDKAWTGYKHDYMRGHLSYAGMLEAKERPIIEAVAIQPPLPKGLFTPPHGKTSDE